MQHEEFPPPHIEMYLGLEVERPGLRGSFLIGGLEGESGCGYGDCFEDIQYKFDDDIQKVTPARAPLAFSLLSNSALMSKSFSFDLLRLRAKTAWLWLPQSASLTVRCPQRYVHRDQRRI
ncbi:hypothetical protein TNCV_2239241 [Trichonephila clavipes]|nr:hypothetical protein TNCV_2239241 [Trichonephila clavipes]